MTEAGRPTGPVLAFVGAIVADEKRFHGPAFNRAGQMFQAELLRGLAAAGLPPNAILSIEPVPAFPRSRRMFVRPGISTLRSGQLAQLLPFVNVQPLKALTAGVSVFATLVGWAWRHRGRPRVVHCVNLTMPPGIFVLAAARLTRSKAVVSVLDVWKPGALVPDTWHWRLDFRSQRFLIPRFDGLMVVSRAIADDFAPGRRVCLVEGGIAPDLFAGAPDGPTERPPEGPFRIVLSGSLEPYNGVALALDAMAMLPGDYELVIAGTGSLLPLVEERAGRDPRVKYAGFLGFDEVLNLYWSADLVLNARVTRAIDTRYFFPSKLMELLASGTPVLSTCTGQVEQDYGHVAYLLRDETPEALAARIREIAGLPADERAALGRRAREFMFAEKTWDRQAARLVRYIQNEVLRNA